MASLTPPSSFVTVQDVLEGKFPPGRLVSIVGIVTDFRAPIPVASSRSDWKAEVRFYDKSIEYDTEASLSFHIFLPKDEIPNFGPTDAIVLIMAKVQKRPMQPFSLITNWNTDIHVFSGQKIPRPPANASVALLPAVKKAHRSLSEAEFNYVSTFYHGADKGKVPAPEEFESMKIQSTNTKNKYRELKDVENERFSDIICQIVKAPYDLGDKITLWVSDYTENENFFNHQFSLPQNEGDPYGYGFEGLTSSQPDANWKGPFGKRSMQVTCYEPHATAIRNLNMSEGSWIFIRNVQIKYGHNFANLEGFLREDRGSHGVKVNVTLMHLDDSEYVDSRLKDALRRKREYEQTKRQQLKSISEAAKAGQKRKADMAEEEVPQKDNAKSRRAKKRSKGRKSEQLGDDSSIVSGLNPQVKCENQNKSPSPVSDLLKPVLCDTIVNGESVQLPLPFVNIHYRIQVKVVDFSPPSLEQFARPKLTSEFDILSDDGASGSDSDEESEARNTSSEWEWRFFLKVQDAAASKSEGGQSVWILVDNPAAQCLVDMDASDLKSDPEKLDTLRQRLFTLWGELEERKSQQEAAAAERKLNNAMHDRPPESSDDEGQAQKKLQPLDQVANRPFSCCVRQYGVKVHEPDPAKATAGKNRRWERVFGLFGTRISV